jgi:diguanylate cyclase (GGDEF)-like protein
VFAEDPSPFTAEVLDHAVRLAQLAIDHCRLYEDLQFQARHDSLTGLPNRSLYEERLSRALREALDLKQRLAVLYVDLDKFKLINDSTSHRIGDLFLCEIAARMRSVVRSGDTVARIGGDEFNILLHNISNEGEAETIAERIRNAVRQAVVIEGRTLAVSASVGIAFFPDDGTNAEDLQRDADAAMYCAKGMGRDRVQVFGARNESLDRVRMEHDLRAALRDRLFAVHYQPKVSAGGLFGGLEALLRLEHPVHGQIPPARFIPMAEETGLIVPLGAWVLDEVCRQIAEWRASGLGTIPVAVNVSPVQISRPEFAQQVEEALARHSVSPFSLDLELTESQLIGSGEESQQQMRRLRAIGVTFSLDDFGTGYSSLSYLHRLKVDAIKLDRSFVQSIDTDEAARRLVQAMIGVAQGLGLNVIAEGVETEAQRAVLIAAGCPMMQGYLFSRPRPPAELREYLASVASAPDDLARIGRVLGHAASSEEQLQTV